MKVTDRAGAKHRATASQRQERLSLILAFMHALLSTSLGFALASVWNYNVWCTFAASNVWMRHAWKGIHISS